MFRLGVVTLVPELWGELLSESAGLVGKAFHSGKADKHIVNAL